MEPLGVLGDLAAIQGASCVTLYLNTRLKELGAREQARQFVHRRIERALRAARDEPEIRADLERVRDEALRRVDAPEDGAPAAIAVFACATRNLFRVVELDLPVEDQLVVANEPSLKQLAALSSSYDRTLLALVSAEDARIYELLLGRVESFETVAGGEINTHRAARKSPGWTQLRYQRQVREQIERHLREVAARLTELFDRDHPPQLLVGGVQPTIDRFLHELPDRIRVRVKDVVSLAPGTPIAEVVHAAVATSRADEMARAADGVRETVDLALADGPAALGIDEVLEAAQQKRLMTLYLDPDFRHDGFLCRDCASLARRDDGSGSCAFCAGTTTVVELGEALVRQAILQSGEVEFVPRSSTLGQFEGVAAKLRW